MLPTSFDDDCRTSHILTELSEAAVASQLISCGWKRTVSTGAVWPAMVVTSRPACPLVVELRESRVQIRVNRSLLAIAKKVPALFHETLRELHRLLLPPHSYKLTFIFTSVLGSEIGRSHPDIIRPKEMIRNFAWPDLAVDSLRHSGRAVKAID